MLSDELNGLFCLISLSDVGVRKNDAGSVGNLVVIELTKVLHIHLALVDVGNGSEAVECSVLGLYGLYRLDNIGKLTNATGLNNNSVGVEFIKHLCKRLREITYERATDTAGVHLGNLNACILEEATVNADFTELVLDKHELFACVSFLNKLLYKSSLAGSEEAGENIYFRHIQIMPRGANLRKYVLYL